MILWWKTRLVVKCLRCLFCTWYIRFFMGSLLDASKLPDNSLITARIRSMTGRYCWWGLSWLPSIIKTWPGYCPTLRWGTPPPSRHDQVPPLHPGMGYPPPSRPGWGTPNPGMGYPPNLGWGTTPPPRQSSIASTCYAAGGMRLAFTQEDFLVRWCFPLIVSSVKIWMVKS